MMNRKCRRKHEAHWKTKVVSENRRLVVCTLCGGTEQEWKVRPDVESSSGAK